MEAFDFNACQVSLLTPAEIKSRWYLYESLVKQALEYEETPVKAVKVFERLMDTLCMGAAIYDQGVLCGFVVFEFKKYGSELWLDVLLLGGDDLDHWLLELYGTLTDYARNARAAGIRVQGRPGWSRKLKQYGFREVSRTLRLEIE